MITWLNTNLIEYAMEWTLQEYLNLFVTQSITDQISFNNKNSIFVCLSNTITDCAANLQLKIRIINV